MLDNSPENTQRLIKDVVSQILNLSKSSLINYRYEKLIKIYINQDKYLEDLLEFIMLKDDECSNVIIHRRIELCLERIKQGEGISQNGEKIIEILKNKKYSPRYDQNYLLMLFKTHNYTNGIIAISEIMQLRQELLTIYMENHNFDKVMYICTNYGGMDNNFWVQALNYFIKIESDNVVEYVKTILDNVIDNDIIPPILILDILKSKKDMTFEPIRYFINKIVDKEQKEIKKNESEFQANEEKEEKYNVELRELRTKASQFSVYKCAICNQPTSNLNVVPIVFYLCNHAYHMHCLNTEIRDDENSTENPCPQCWNRSHQVTQRINQSKERANNNNEFRMELDSKQRKFDQVAKYLGMGLFNN